MLKVIMYRNRRQGYYGFCVNETEAQEFIYRNYLGCSEDDRLVFVLINMETGKTVFTEYSH